MCTTSETCRANSVIKTTLNNLHEAGPNKTQACKYSHYFLSRNSTTKQMHSPPGTLNFENTDNGTVTEEEGKAIPLQSWRSPEGSRRLRLPDIKTIGT